MSWTTLDLNNLLSGEPLIESEVLAVYENPIAIADGDPGAPRNAARSIRSERLPLVNGTGFTASGWLSLDPLSVVELFVSHRRPSSTSNCDMRGSDNNGATYGPWVDFTVSGGDIGALGQYYINLETGLIQGVGGSTFSMFSNANLDITNINALQIRGRLDDVVYAAHGRAIMRSNGD